MKYSLARIQVQRNTMTFHITLEPAEDGWIVAECPALPGCVSQGRDEEEAIQNIREAITAWMRHIKPEFPTKNMSPRISTWERSPTSPVKTP